MWKALVLAFPLLRNWMVWKIGNGKSTSLGVDPQIDVDLKTCFKGKIQPHRIFSWKWRYPLHFYRSVAPLFLTQMTTYIMVLDNKFFIYQTVTPENGPSNKINRDNRL